MNIEINEVLVEYKNRLADATHDNVILKAQGAMYSKKVEELEERLAQLESQSADVERSEPVSGSVIEGSVVED